MYTGIVSDTLWNVFINKSRPIRRAMVAIIILLYFATTINFFLNWLVTINSATLLLVTWPPPPIFYIEIGIAAAVSTVVADSAIIWRCCMVWGRRWLIVLFPIFCLITVFVFKILEVFTGAFSWVENVRFLVVYLSCILATTLWCAILIVLRIVTVIRAQNGTDNRLGDYRRVIEVLVESSAPHSVTLIVFVALEASGSFSNDDGNCSDSPCRTCSSGSRQSR
ncbi:hypothetical protein IW262DRAFT_525464 [Armillaria fumosa]|nr:hypothetical protein IW262DRAFT_525464 [Armillaria fumosa]